MTRTSRTAAWRAHLRAGGSTPWAEFTGAPVPADDWLPGAQQLELLRRVNARRPVSPEFADRILAATLPFRGMPDLDLAGEPGQPSESSESGQPNEPGQRGPAPVDPAELPDRELVRVAVAVLEQAAVARTPGPVAPRPATPADKLARGLRRVARRPVTLAGDPVFAAQVRRALRPRGVRFGDGGDVLVLADRMDRMLLDAWWHRVTLGGAAPWGRWVESLCSRDTLPASIDIPALARRWRDERPGRVSVVIGEAGVAEALGAPGVEREPVSQPGLELQRRVGMLLGVLVEPHERTRLLRRGVLPRGVLPPPDSAPTVPAHAQEWVSRQAERMTDLLRRADYPVVGEWHSLQPTWRAVDGSSQPDEQRQRLSRQGVLPLAIEAVGALAVELDEGDGA